MANYVNIFVPEADPPMIAHTLEYFDTFPDGTIETEVNEDGVGAICHPDGSATVITVDPNTLEVSEPWLAEWSEVPPK